jgi:cytochrome P450
VYENPFAFNHESFVGSEVGLKNKDFQLLPFGSRRQICLGLSLGLLTMQILARLIHNFAEKLPLRKIPKNIDMGESFGLATPKAIPLQAIAIARLPLQLYSTPKFV